MKSIPSKEIHHQCLGELEKIKVLLYHHVTAKSDMENNSAMMVQKEIFHKQLEWLDRWDYTTITFEDVRLFLAHELNLPKKPVIITFDDGYADVYEWAYPILREFGMKAVVFILGDRFIRESNWDKGLCTLSPLLNQQQILEMSSYGIEIGAHSMRHAKLTMITEKEATEEIIRSRILLEIFLNNPVKSFAYPYGLVNESIKNIVKEAGYTIACGAYSGPAMFGRDLFEIRRILVANTSNWFRFRWQLHSLYLYAHWFNWGLKKYFGFQTMKSTLKKRI